MSERQYMPETPLPYIGGLTDSERNVTLREYLFYIARRQGDSIHLYHDTDFDKLDARLEELRKTQKEIEALELCSDEEAEALAQKDYESRLEIYSSKKYELEKIKWRLKNMQTKIRTWRPPDATFEGIKTQALNELEYGLRELEIRIKKLIAPTKENGTIYVIERLQMLRDWSAILERTAVEAEFDEIQKPVIAERLAAFLDSIRIIESDG